MSNDDPITATVAETSIATIQYVAALREVFADKMVGIGGVLPLEPSGAQDDEERE